MLAITRRPFGQTTYEALPKLVYCKSNFQALLFLLVQLASIFQYLPDLAVLRYTCQVLI